MNLSRRAILAAPLALAACKTRKEVLSFSGLTMGTGYNVVAVDHEGQLDANTVLAAIEAALHDVNALLSNWDDASEISRFNASLRDAPVAMSHHLARVMTASMQVQEHSRGSFDTTIGPLIELWGFGAGGVPSRPAAAAVEATLDATSHGNTLRVEDGRIAKKLDSTQVYLAGVGKGYGADVVGNALRQLGLDDFLVEIGGDVVTSGRNPDDVPWQIGIETPAPNERSVFNVIGVSGQGLATSGDYRNYFEEDGRRYSHLIDPTTGYPVQHTTASATVIAEDSMMADAWSTAMLILGRERGLEVATERGIAVQFLERDPNAGDLSFKTHASSEFMEVAA